MYHALKNENNPVIRFPPELRSVVRCAPWENVGTRCAGARTGPLRGPWHLRQRPHWGLFGFGADGPQGTLERVPRGPCPKTPQGPGTSIGSEPLLSMVRGQACRQTYSRQVS